MLQLFKILNCERWSHLLHSEASENKQQPIVSLRKQARPPWGPLGDAQMRPTGSRAGRACSPDSLPGGERQEPHPVHQRPHCAHRRQGRQSIPSFAVGDPVKHQPMLNTLPLPTFLSRNKFTPQTRCKILDLFFLPRRCKAFPEM